MANHALLYDILYALAARDGREAALFGTCAPRAREAFLRSDACEVFPELWFELPLAGEPWFDLHVATNVDSLSAGDTFAAETTGGHPEVFSWFATQGDKVRQLILSWDVSTGSDEDPAVHLLVPRSDPQPTCTFLETVGKPTATPAYRAFVDHMPKGWFAAYTGVFPSRPAMNLRVECIPAGSLQRAYAQDASLLERDLRQMGVRMPGNTFLPRCQQLAAQPFALEFQFDVTPEGVPDTTVGISLRFSYPPSKDGRQSFDPEGAAGSLMRQVEKWGLADSRWHLLADTKFSKRLRGGDKDLLLFCLPTFIKLRWRDGEPLDAKAYLMAGVQ